MSTTCNEVLLKGRQNMIMVGFNTENVSSLSAGNFYFSLHFHFYFFHGIREDKRRVSQCSPRAFPILVYLDLQV